MGLVHDHHSGEYGRWQTGMALKSVTESLYPETQAQGRERGGGGERWIAGNGVGF